ncbi:MAG: methylated-DNA--[protein]-cysteine S-methyltransferase [Bacillota bacterium]|nr:methylated-DNA--[protein]-cysteine S-methyltransferase [Bacillota bacterium]
MIFWDKFESPVGELYAAEKDGSITMIGHKESAERYFRKSGSGGSGIPENAERRRTEVIERAVFQLNEYFEGKRKKFDLPLAPEGTDFQLKDWKALCEIPYGETRSYRDIAEAIDCPGGYRAVGMANNRNPIMIVIPCHRVIGANGSMVGYGGGIPVKQYLIELEKNNI